MSSQPLEIASIAGVDAHPARWDSTRAAAVGAGLKRLWDFYAFHQALGAVSAKIATVSRDLHALERAIADGDLGRAEERLAAAEKRALALDDKIRVWRFRRRFLDRHLPSDVVTGYLGLLAARMGSDPDRRDRVEFLATHLVSIDGAALRPDEAVPLLEKIGTHRAESADRIAAERWLHDVMDRIHRDTSVEDVFSSGILLDLKVYKRSLGKDLVDPAILHAVVMVNLAIQERLDFLADAEGIARGEIGYKFWKTDLQLQRLLRRQAEIEELERPVRAPLPKVDWVHHRWRNGLGPKRGGRKAAAPKKARKPIVALSGALLLLVAVKLLLSAGAGSRSTMVAVSPYDLQLISPAFASGAISNSEPPILTVRVDPGRWHALGESRRNAAAERLRAGLAGLHAASAIALDGRAVAIQIDGGKVLLVQ